MPLKLVQDAPTRTDWFSTNAHEPVSYEVHFYPPEEGENLSINGLYGDDSRLYKMRLATIFSGLGLRTVYIPTVRQMSGIFYGASYFSDIMHLPLGVMIRRPEVPCDATRVPRHDGFAMAGGGCPLIVLTFRDARGDPVCLAAHAGRASLIDMKWVTEHAAPREHFSVVNALVHYARSIRVDPGRMTLRIFGGIPWEDFRHSSRDPIYGTGNSLLITEILSRYGPLPLKISKDGHEHLCLNTLIEAQAYQAGIGTVEAHDFGLPRDGAFPYAPDPRRYLAVVVHR